MRLGARLRRTVDRPEGRQQCMQHARSSMQHNTHRATRSVPCRTGRGNPRQDARRVRPDCVQVGAAKQSPGRQRSDECARRSAQWPRTCSHSVRARWSACVCACVLSRGAVLLQAATRTRAHTSPSCVFGRLPRLRFRGLFPRGATPDDRMFCFLPRFMCAVSFPSLNG